MHVGHCRGAVFGDALASLLAFAGYDVTREYYINDAGAQVDVLARSAFLRYREALGETSAIPEGLYPGDYLKPVGQALAAEHGDKLLEAMPEAEWLPPCAQGDRRDDGDDQGRSRRAQYQARCFLFRARADRTADRQPRRRDDRFSAPKGDVYEGRLPPPKGAPVEDYEDREQTCFRSTAFGDDVDRPLIKSDGSYTYFASDIAYHKNKFDRGFRNLIDVWGADHGGYIKRMQAAVKAVTSGKARSTSRSCSSSSCCATASR
jgi:arginyl-tRNA synthetase